METINKGCEEIERRCLQMTKLDFILFNQIYCFDFNAVVIDIYKLGWQLRTTQWILLSIVVRIITKTRSFLRTILWTDKNR